MIAAIHRMMSVKSPVIMMLVERCLFCAAAVMVLSIAVSTGIADVSLVVKNGTHIHSLLELDVLLPRRVRIELRNDCRHRRACRQQMATTRTCLYSLHKPFLD